ncbi:pyridoxal 5'-phosphate synthase glutaminase subunit PdxT [Utexia brackfieldae]|uniref:pyridoxal 5'-phosphate synthase glutaminase subunit PdxT n=1 Tax=Utexia brackfieldae TaxID=3074108 RepID=UPI00370D9F99
MKKIGVLALQGAVCEHLTMLRKLQVDAISIKQPDQLETLNGLIIPGGESTAISRLIEENHFHEAIVRFAQSGKAILGTCAGLILCAKSIKPSPLNGSLIKPLGLMDMIVERNGFGRQVDSFEIELDIQHIGNHIPAVFIRAPYITSVGAGVEVLATIDDHIVMAKQQNILVAAFHPELTPDNRIMDYFIAMTRCT